MTAPDDPDDFERRLQRLSAVVTETEARLNAHGFVRLLEQRRSADGIRLAQMVPEATLRVLMTALLIDYPRETVEWCLRSALAQVMAILGPDPEAVPEVKPEAAPEVKPEAPAPSTEAPKAGRAKA